MDISCASYDELKDILELQRLSYQSEAAMFKDPIPPLKQTLEEVQEEHRTGIILKAVEGGRLLGSVRAHLKGGTVSIGKLFVHPDWRGRGIGTALLKAAEERFPQQRFELFTSTKSLRNLELYERNGYRVFRRQSVSDELEFVFLEKG